MLSFGSTTFLVMQRRRRTAGVLLTITNAKYYLNSMFPSFSVNSQARWLSLAMSNVRALRPQSVWRGRAVRVSWHQCRRRARMPCGAAATRLISV